MRIINDQPPIINYQSINYQLKDYVRIYSKDYKKDNPLVSGLW